MITVLDALKIGQLQKARLVGGRKGLKRQVTSVNVMDAPDIINWVKEGELLLTTAYVIKDDPVAQEQLISGLNERGCAGLAVKAKRFLEFCPEHMVEAADRANFPLIELPPEHSLSDIMVPLLGAMLNRKSILLEQSLDIHQNLTTVALKGGGVKDVIEALAGLVDNPVFLYDETGSLLAGTSADGKDEDQLFLPKLKDESRRERQAERSAEVKVMVNHRAVGRIVLLERSRKVSDIDKMAMEHAATIIALHYFRQMTVDEAAERLKTEFLDDLMSENYDSYAALANRAVALGFKADLGYCCVVFQLNRFSDRRYDSREYFDDDLMLKNQIGKHISRSIEKQGLTAVTIWKGNRIFAFVACSPGAYRDPTSFIPVVMEDVKAILPQLMLNIGYGRPAPFRELKRSCESAIISLEIGAKIHDQNSFISGYKEVEVYNILREGLKGNEMERFVENTVGSILKYDRKFNAELLNTLDVYFQCQGNITKGAQQLFIHRNTMIYRLDRIRSLLKHWDLENPEEVLTLQLGIRAAKLINPKLKE